MLKCAHAARMASPFALYSRPTILIIPLIKPLPLVICMQVMLEACCGVTPSRSYTFEHRGCERACCGMVPSMAYPSVQHSQSTI